MDEKTAKKLAFKHLRERIEALEDEPEFDNFLGENNIDCENYEVTEMICEALADIRCQIEALEKEEE